MSRGVLPTDRLTTFLRRWSSDPAGILPLRAEYTRTLAPSRTLASETQQFERRLSELVNQAYGLTLAEIAQLWETAPPRMPIAPPTA